MEQDRMPKSESGGKSEAAKDDIAEGSELGKEESKDAVDGNENVIVSFSTDT